MWNEKHLIAKGAAALLILLALMGTTELPALTPGTQAQPASLECELTLSPAELEKAPRPVVVRASLSEEIGPIQRVVVEDRSGVEVEGLEIPSPRAIVITLKTEEAQAGEWTVTAQAEEASCTGKFTVPAPGVR
jgi:hypothetical protein